MTRALLVLEDATVFEGIGFGAPGEAIGEVVFNTALSGYQEILTDPSYKGQIVCMTCPEIGNVGVNDEDVEGARPHVEGFLVRRLHPRPSNWRSQRGLEEYLADAGVVGIQGIDTRALVLKLREQGALMGILSTQTLDSKLLLERVRRAPGLVGRDLVREVTRGHAEAWTEPPWEGRGASPASEGSAGRVVVIDFGVKRNILRRLVGLGFSVEVVPARTPASDILKLRPRGVVLSNGPGDPAALPYAAEATRGLLGKVPIFGICLGHQILGLSLGGTTYKLKFGHHGANHPVKDLATGRVAITSQNHGFAVDVDSLKGRAEVTHLNLNDQTVEGMRVADPPAFSVQYHPEASPGPHDSWGLFRQFREMMKGATP